ncbi:MAG: hypothetical protein LBG52_05360 [Candidatus Peribacteria bacterium]|nr:hypothetical protein [Candidatus Peribacteria bacterium]
MTCIQLSLAFWIASRVKLNCWISTFSSAPSEVLRTLELSRGEGVYPTSHTFRPNASAVRMILPTL